ncbi:MAG: carbohydrate-binding protein [Spirochaetales bacterium]|nr:carbohydrate-binding protein [Spirochaetales bacterium]
MKKNFFLTVIAVLAFVVSCGTTGGGGDGMASSTEPPANPTTVIKLQAADAKLTTNAQLQYEQSADRDNIGWWEKTDDLIDWTLEVKEAGTYWVMARVSCDPQFPGSEVNVTVNNKVLNFTVPDTGSWTDYVMLNCGSVDLKPGSYPVRVQATKVASRFVCNLAYLSFMK